MTGSILNMSLSGGGNISFQGLAVLSPYIVDIFAPINAPPGAPPIRYSMNRQYPLAVNMFFAPWFVRPGSANISVNISFGPQQPSPSYMYQTLSYNASSPSLYALLPPPNTSMSYSVSISDASMSINLCVYGLSESRGFSIVYDQIVISMKAPMFVAVGQSIPVYGSASYKSDGSPVPSGYIAIYDGNNTYVTRITNGRFYLSIPAGPVTQQKTLLVVAANDYPYTGISVYMEGLNTSPTSIQLQSSGSGALSAGLVDTYTYTPVSVSVVQLAQVNAPPISPGTLLTTFEGQVVLIMLAIAMAIGLFIILIKIYSWPVAGVIAGVSLLLLLYVLGLTQVLPFVMLVIVVLLAFHIYRS